MSIFNTGGPLMAGSGGKVATWTGSGTSSTATSISFTVDSPPTQWLLVCVSSINGYAGAGSLYGVVNARWVSGGSISAICARVASNTVRLYPNSGYLNETYSNGTLTITSSGSRTFFNTSSVTSGGSQTWYPVTYYLFYNTN